MPPPNTPELATATEYPAEARGACRRPRRPSCASRPAAQRGAAWRRRRPAPPSGSRVRVGDVLHVGVEARRGDAEVGPPAGVRHVDRPRSRPPRAPSQAGSGSNGIPSLRAKSLPRPPGRMPSTPSVPRTSPATAPVEPVAAHRRRRLARRDRAARELARVLDRRRALHAEGEAAGAQRRLGARQPPGRAAAAGARVHDQAEGLHGAGDARGSPARRASRRRAWAAAPLGAPPRWRRAREHERAVHPGARGRPPRRCRSGRRRPGSGPAPSRSRAASYIAASGLPTVSVGRRARRLLDGGEHGARAGPGPVGHREASGRA